MSETIYLWVIIVFAFVVGFGVLVGLGRGRKIVQTNAAIEANQRKLIEMQQQQLSAVERTAAAQERIAAALEVRK